MRARASSNPNQCSCIITTIASNKYEPDAARLVCVSAESLCVRHNRNNNGEWNEI